MARKQHTGICHICGINGKLSFEHVPPQAAFNDRPIIRPKFDDFIGQGPDITPKGKIEQKGAGGYTLCESCNNKTGSWYAKDFVEMAYQSLRFLDETKEFGINLYLPYYIFPLRVIKQIISMFLSVNPPEFAQRNPQLVKFILNKDEKYLDPKIRIYLYLTNSLLHRSTGITGLGDLESLKMNIFSEISFPPFGYVLTVDSQPPDYRLFDISYFSRYGYNHWDVFHLNLALLPVHLYLPGDYRTRKEIYQDSTIK